MTTIANKNSKVSESSPLVPKDLHSTSLNLFRVLFATTSGNHAVRPDLC